MKRAILLAIAGLFMGSAAMADDPAYDHTVYLVHKTFFPVISYVQPGQVVRFINDSSTNRQALADDESWLVGPLQQNEAALLTITEEMTMVFHNTDPGGEIGDESLPSQDPVDNNLAEGEIAQIDTVAVPGSFSFDPDPQADGDDLIIPIALD